MEIIENLIDEFQRLGYAVNLDDENIKLKYGLHDKPDRLRIIPLLDILKEHKADVIGYLKNTQIKTKVEVRQDNPSMPGHEINAARPTPVKPEPVMPQQTCRKDRFVNAKLDQHLCHSCGSVGERYMLNMDRRIGWSWFCLKCRPYTEPERKQDSPAL